MASILLAVGIPLSPWPGPETANDVVAWIVTLLVLGYLAYECLHPWPDQRSHAAARRRRAAQGVPAAAERRSR